MVISGIEVIRKYIKTLSEEVTGVYKMFDCNGQVIYVGKAKNITKRLLNYLRLNELTDRIRSMVNKVAKIDIIINNSEIDALLLESQLIKTLKPRYNIILKDDKSYPYIVFTEHDFPRICKYRGIIKGKSFYGPFVSSLTLKNTIMVMQKSFLLRTCNDTFFARRIKPCMLYDIKLCSAPCVGFVTKEEYNKLVRMAHNTLTGRSKEVQNTLLTLMFEASSREDYELAAVYRDRLKSLQQMQERTVSPIGMYNVDVIGMYREYDICCMQILSFRQGYNYGYRSYFLYNTMDSLDEEIIFTFIIQFYKIDIPEKIFIGYSFENLELLNLALNKVSNNPVKVKVAKKRDELKCLEIANKKAKESLFNKVFEEGNKDNILKELAAVFNLKAIPERIEVYDNSHTSGSEQVGVMIVAGKNGFLRKEYKKYNIKSLFIDGDDYAMMSEVLKRRFSGSQKLILPDLIIIDGGRGHLTVVKKLLEELDLNIPFICMAKGIDRNAGKERFYQIGKKALSLDNYKGLLLYLQSIRNEAHRYAIMSHRKKRKRAFLSDTCLDKIPGLGLIRKKALITYFGSITKLKKASIDDIKKVPGISIRLAKQILDYFQ